MLRLEYRSKLLNTKWAEAMVSQGSGGAFEISQQMTALLGWGATTDFKKDWVYDQAIETYVDNEQARRRTQAQGGAEGKTGRGRIAQGAQPLNIAVGQRGILYISEALNPWRYKNPATHTHAPTFLLFLSMF